MWPGRSLIAGQILRAYHGYFETLICAWFEPLKNLLNLLFNQRLWIQIYFQIKWFDDLLSTGRRTNYFGKNPVIILVLNRIKTYFLSLFIKRVSKVIEDGGIILLNYLSFVYEKWVEIR